MLGHVKKKTPEDALRDKTIIMMYFLRHFEALRNLQLSGDCLGTFFFFFFFFGDRIRSAHDSFLVVSVSVRLHAVCVPGWSIATSPGCKCCFHVLFRVVTSYSALEGCRIPECCSGYRCTGRGVGGPALLVAEIYPCCCFVVQVAFRGSTLSTTWAQLND